MLEESYNFLGIRQAGTGSSIRNLIDNVIKHHHQSDGRIDISARNLGDFIEFSVTDDGPGIDPTFHERVFQIFQTLQPRDTVESSGVGLALVKRQSRISAAPLA